MKTLVTVVIAGVVLLLASLPFSGFVAAQTDATTDVQVADTKADVPAADVTTDAQRADAKAAGDDYQTLQKDLKQDRLADALRRIQMLEQENRFLRRRIELVERDVNDIKNDRY